MALEGGWRSSGTRRGRRAVRRRVPASGTGLPLEAQPARRPLSVWAGYAKFADQLRDTGLFDTPEQWRFDQERAYTRDRWLALLPTTGGVTRLPADRTAEILQAVGAAVDALGGRFTMLHTTLATAAVRVTTGA
ncbi:hypothetical protein ACWDWO_12695 [Actinopolymorpha singaporensis]